MLVSKNGVSTFTSDQTINPFTSTTRIFNQKEANSTGNCVSGMDCSLNSSLQNKFMKDATKRSNNLSTTLKNIQKNNDTRSGLLNTVESFSNTSNAVATQEPSDPNDAKFNKMMNYGTNKSVEVDNSTPQDYTYNSYADNRSALYNQWTRSYDDNCNESNRLQIASKPMKYYVNELNSPQINPFQEYAIIGNQQPYNVRNDFERAIPSRLNPIYPVQIEPYKTTPFLGASNPDRMYSDTDANLRWGSNMRPLKSQNATSEVDYNQWAIVDAATVQNAGQFEVSGQHRQNAINTSLTMSPNGPNDGYYDYHGKNNVLFTNSASMYIGISSRNILHNQLELGNC